MTQPIPEGYHSVTPSLTFKDSKKAIEFYKKAFGAKVLDFFPSPTGQGIMHATIKIGDSILMMGDEMPQCKSAETLGGSSISLFIYVPNVDEAFNQAVADDVKPGKYTSFPQSVKLKPSETVVFAYVVYKSRAHRDSVNAKVMKDPRIFGNKLAAGIFTPRRNSFHERRLDAYGSRLCKCCVRRSKRKAEKP